MNMLPKQNVEGKYLSCNKCGAVGGTLVKLDKGIYACQDDARCAERRRMSGAAMADICSKVGCILGAKYRCSCGMILCGNCGLFSGHSKRHFLLPMKLLPEAMQVKIKTPTSQVDLQAAVKRQLTFKSIKQ